MNYQGNINLSKLQKVGIATIKGKKCVVIPIDENDIYIRENEKKDEGARKYSCINIGISMFESRQDNSQFTNDWTHFIGQSFSKEYREKHPDVRISIGNMKPMESKSSNQADSVSAPAVEPDDDDLPF